MEIRTADTLPRAQASERGIFSTADHSMGQERVNKPQSFFHLHLISDATGETLTTTAEHPFYTVSGKWLNAGDLEIGD